MKLRLLLVVVVAVLGWQSGASGAPMVAVGIEVGSGTIAPGLTTTPTFQTAVTYTGMFLGALADAAVAPTDDAVLLNCSWAGSSTIAETIAQGQGQGPEWCDNPLSTHPGYELTCQLSYVRVGTFIMLMVQLGTCQSSLGTAVGTGTDVQICLFEGTNFPPLFTPTTSYTLQCGRAIAPVTL
jgi:hypothetical protein